jgi:hypothetical protein
VRTIYPHNDGYETVTIRSTTAYIIATVAVLKKTVINGKTKPLEMLERRSGFQVWIKTVVVEYTMMEPNLFWYVDWLFGFYKSSNSKRLLQALFEPPTGVGREGLSLWLGTNRVFYFLAIRLYSIHCFQFTGV